MDEVSGVAEGAPAPAEEAATFGAAASLQPALDGARVVKTARLSVLVPRGGFADAFDEASLVASRFGGFVQSSETQGADARSGRLVLRVPVASFDQALQAVRALGRVTGESTQGQDVTAQFVDLQARIRTWEAQEAVLLRLMDQSRTVGDTLRVQRELQGVQLEIERLKGQLQVITDQTDMSTISVSIREPGSPLETQQEDDRLTLIDAWRAAVDGFLGVVYAVIVGLGYLVPLGTLAGIGWLVFRRIRRSA
ncbi:MAG: DUF4349 domain-containing protein [Actinobacteria bacterium]|nr:DUF4349 domain-containing protein [Actinomycetota bacterium]